MDQASPDVFRELGLLPHQAQFAAEFLRPGSAPHHLLLSPVGMGKTRMAVTLVKQVMAGQQSSRILILMPAALCRMYADILALSQKSSLVKNVDRRTFRELEANAPIGGPVWPEPVIAIVSFERAVKDDIAASLVGVPWDLIVVDEAHRLTGSRRKLIEWLHSTRSARRLLLLSSFPLPIMGELLTRELTPTAWTKADTVDWEGRPLFQPVDRKVQVIDYRRYPVEVDVLTEVRQFAGEMARGDGGSLIAMILIQRASSSPLALEQTLMSIRRTLKPSPRDIRPDLESDLEWLSEDEPAVNAAELLGISDSNPIRKAFTNLSEAADRVDKLIRSLDNIESDEKLKALIQLLRKLQEERQGRAVKVCVSTSFQDTATYLHAAVLDAGLHSFLFSGMLSPDSRNSVIEQFQNEGGVLIATPALHEGYNLKDVESVICYDLPGNLAQVVNFLGRFDRFDRKTPWTLFALRDTSGAIPADDKLPKLLAAMGLNGLSV